MQFDIMTILWAIVHVVLIAAVAPFVEGVIRTAKARMQSRRGAGPLQPYRDLWKYLRKDAVFSEHSSWLSRFTPYISIAGMLTVGLMIPMVEMHAPLAWAGDFLLMLYLFGLVRFFTTLTAYDAGSSFGGMCSVRDLMLSAIAEPAMILGGMAILLKIGTMNLVQAVVVIDAKPDLILEPTYVLALIAMGIVLIAETGRIPVDNPDTHLGLTMIHEGMLLEYSGRYLGLMLWAAQIRQVVLYSIFIALFCPWGMVMGASVGAWVLALGCFVVKLLVLGLVLAVVETLYAKMRLFLAPKLLMSSMVLSVLAIVITVVK